MRCVYCSSESTQMKLANAEGGLVRLPVCNIDEIWLEETFDRPLTLEQLIGMQKEVLK